MTTSRISVDVHTLAYPVRCVLPGRPTCAIISLRFPYPAQPDPSSLSPVNGIEAHTMALINALIDLFTQCF